MPLNMALHPALNAVLSDFHQEKFAQWVDQAADREVRMKKVFHDHWVHPVLDDIRHKEFGRLLHQAEELEAALYLHQAQMKNVCHSIKAHDHWVYYGEYFPSTLPCRLCGVEVSPEFDRRRHKGLCIERTLSVIRSLCDWF